MGDRSEGEIRADRAEGTINRGRKLRGRDEESLGRETPLIIFTPDEAHSDARISLFVPRLSPGDGSGSLAWGTNDTETRRYTPFLQR